MSNERNKTERDRLVEKLREIAKGGRRSKVTRLREIFDEVEAARADGATNKEIVAGLAELGLIYDVNTFKNALSNIRKERSIEALKRPQTSVASAPTTSAQSTDSQKQLLGAIETAKSTPDMAKTQNEQPATKSSSQRKKIFKDNKGIFGDLEPAPIDGVVDLKQK